MIDYMKNFKKNPLHFDYSSLEIISKFFEFFLKIIYSFKNQHFCEGNERIFENILKFLGEYLYNPLD
jgi:hypothetical protein